MSRKWKRNSLLILLWIASGIFLWSFQQWIKIKCPHQQLAIHWSQEQSYAQLSTFFSRYLNISKQEIQLAEEGIQQVLEQNGIDSESEQNWISAYSVQDTLAVSGEKTTKSMQAIGVGGNFFSFHPFLLKSGTWFDTNHTYMVVLNEKAAWELFGSFDIEGMELQVEGDIYSVSGVIQQEKSPFLEKTGAYESQIYLSYDRIKQYRPETGITCYEVIMPNPIRDFALNTLKKQPIFVGANTELVQNTDRFSFKRRIQQLSNFFSRTMKTDEICYPFWENEVRAWEEVWDILLVIQCIWIVIGGITFLWYMNHWKRWYRRKKHL